MTPTDSHAPWRRMPLFVASTFRDMDRERDLLARVVIPSVNERLRERGHGVSIYPVDLRWGVKTDDRFDAETRQRVILQVCAGEVRRCRPLFLGLLGGEYGWVPPPHLGEEARTAAGVADPGFPLSVTALEILAAVRESVTDGAAPVLLARTGAEEVPAQKRFRHHLRDLPIAYEPEAFTATATAELVRLLDFVLAPPVPGDWLTDELRAHRWAAEQEAEHFVGRADELSHINEYWDYRTHLSDMSSGDDPDHPVFRRRKQFAPTALALVGPSGSGKSALMAMAATRMKFHGLAGYEITEKAYVRVGATPASESIAVCVLLLLAQLEAERAQEIARRHGPAELRLDDVLEPWLETLRGSMRLHGPLVVVDGLDRFGGELTESHALAWLPIDLGDRVRLLVSAAEGSFEADLLRVRPATQVMDIGELRVRDAVVLVAKRLTGHHKAVPAALVQRLVSRSTFARWLVVASELLATLMAHDYMVLRNADLGGTDPEVALRQLLEETVEDLPPDVGDLQLTAMYRLLDLVDVRLGLLLCVVGVSVYGVTEDDLHAVVEGSGMPSMSSADMALFRDVLSAFIRIQDSRWTFAHDTVEVGVDRLVAEASEAVETDVELGYRNLFIRALLMRPVTDVSRSRELLPQLLMAGALPTLAAFLADEERATDDSVRIFCVFLMGFVRGGGPLEMVSPLVGAGANDRERLTSVAVLAPNLIPMSSRDIGMRIADACRIAIASASSTATSRFGHTAEDLAALIDALTLDPFSADVGENVEGAWLDEAMRSGVGSVADLPAVPADATDLVTRMRAITGTAVLTEYAVAVCLEAVNPAPGDATEAASRLEYWRRLLEWVPWPDKSTGKFLELQLKLTERALLLAWPDHGFTADESDFAQVLALIDKHRGSPDVVGLLGVAARLHALACLESMPDDFSSPLLQDALKYLDEAIWELDVQRFLTPHAILVELRMIQCRVLHMRVLEMCGQLGSARSAGLPALTARHAVDLMGWPAYVLGAMDWLKWCHDAFVDNDPRPVIERFAAEIDQRPGTLDTDTTQLAELMMLMMTMRAAGRFGHFEFAEQMIVRLGERLREGLVVEPEDVRFVDVVLGFADEAEAEIEEYLREDPDDEEALKAAAAMRRLRELAERRLP
ncbi:DUF4062 domain-containing protein [Lentzea alba]|uniref:DUF4062 domain-containing protein n=1 Tax=Lentzea alba TaxID=2714351 RepID=UPI0039BF7482